MQGPGRRLPAVRRIRSALLAASAILLATGALAHPPEDEALAELRRRLAENPGDASAWASRGELLRLLGRRTEAETSLGRALELEPSFVEVELDRARLYLAWGRTDDAVAAASAFLDRSARDAPLRGTALVIRAQAHRGSGRLAEALADLEAALDSVPCPPPELFLERLDLLGAWLDSLDPPPPAKVRRARLIRALDQGIDRLGPVVTLQRPAIRLELLRGDLDAARARLRSIRTGTAGRSGCRAVRRAPADSSEAALATLTRGPYLQRTTADGVVVRWRTDTASGSRVAWGGDPGTLSSEVVDPAAVSEHEVALSGLAAETCFFYSVGTESAVLAGADADHFFCTAPGASTPIRVWVLGDSGTADANAAAVRDAYLGLYVDPRPDVWLMLGDNAYPNGTDPEYQAAVFDMYPSLLRQTSVWPTFGNHDAHSASSVTLTGPYYDSFTLPAAGEAGGLASGTEAYYAFDHGPAHFICLDSAGFTTPTSAMLDWLAADLAAADRPWVVVFFHHPPYSKGSHDSDNPADSAGRLFAMREIVLPILESYGVDLVLAGHSHAYERSVLIDGHYGTSDQLDPEMVLDGGSGSPFVSPYQKRQGPHQGAVYAVAGSSGRVGGGSFDHPVMQISLAELGSLVLTIDPSLLTGFFVDDQGNQLDLFRIERDPSSLFLDGFETGDTSRWDP